MEKLNQMSCEVCRVGTPTATEDEIAEYRQQVPDWSIVERDGVRRLEREFQFLDFQQAMIFCNQLAELSQAEGHHPRICIEWGKVTVTWWTHKIGGLHRNDFVMAAKTDELYFYMPG